MHDSLTFFRQFCERFHTTGAILPSSRFLAHAMIRPIESWERPAHILEVGPGTGAVTRQIVRLMKPGDLLDLVEVNETFAALLNRRFQEDPLYQRCAAQARVHVCPIQQFQSRRKYDFILCGLPLNNFSAETVHEIFEVLFQRLAPHGTLSYFEYMYVRSLKRFVSGACEKARLQEVDTLLAELHSRHRAHRDCVLANVPPAWVQRLRPGSRPSLTLGKTVEAGSA